MQRVSAWLSGPFVSYSRLWRVYERVLLKIRAETPDGSAPATVLVRSEARSSQQDRQQKGWSWVRSTPRLPAHPAELLCLPYSST